MQRWKIIAGASAALAVAGYSFLRSETELLPRVELRLRGAVGRSGENLPSDVRLLRAHLGHLGFRWVANQKTSVDAELIRTIRLVQSIVEGRNVLDGSGLLRPSDPVVARLADRVEAPTWVQMPEGGLVLGFENHELQDTSDNHDFGTGWMANTIAGAGEHYLWNHLAAHRTAALLTVNDVSLPLGGPTPDHAGHQCGMAADLRLPRRDGAAGRVSVADPEYDRDAARAQLIALWKQPLMTRVLLNDPSLVADGLCSSAEGHDNHIHFEIRAPRHRAGTSA